MKKLRIILGVIFILAIIIAIFGMFVNRETLFRNEVSVKYTDKDGNVCIEKFVNRDLVTPECPKEQYKGYGNQQGGLNINWTGINLPTN